MTQCYLILILGFRKQKSLQSGKQTCSYETGVLITITSANTSLKTMCLVMASDGRQATVYSARPIRLHKQDDHDIEASSGTKPGTTS